MSRAIIELSPDILFYAFKYALGRSTYVVTDVVNELHTHWDSFDKFTQIQIQKEIREALIDCDIGMDQDKKNWKIILELKVHEA